MNPQGILMPYKTSYRSAILGFIVLAFGSPSIVWAQLPNGWKAHDLDRPQPKVVTPGKTAADPPSDAIVLFNGKDLSGWTAGNGKPSKWNVVDGVLESVRQAGPIFTQEKFGDCQLHIEFATPSQVKGQGQGRGNSGVYFMGEFEVQVLDSFENETYADGGASALYGQHSPLVNASRGPGQWQTYDIVFRRPRFTESGELLSPARATVFHNGVLVQDSAEYYGPTNWLSHDLYKKGPTADRLSLQDHGNPVRFKNIWIRRLAETKPKPPAPRAAIALTQAQVSNYTGKFGNVTIFEEGDRLFAKTKGRTFGIVPHSLTEFSFERTAGSVVFELDDEGRAKACNVVIDAAGKAGGARSSKD
jgi:hypothetical protein